MGKRIIQLDRSVNLTVWYSLTGILFFLGIFLMLVIHGQQLVNNMQEKFALSIWFSPNSNGDQKQNVLAYLDAQPYTKNLNYIPASEAIHEITQKLDQDIINYLGYNPLPDIVELTLKNEYVKPFNVHQIEKSVLNMGKIDEVIYDKFLLEDMTRIFYVVGLLSIGIMTILIFICIMFIRHSIKMSLYANRFMIKTMQLVGASGSFIRRPFLRQAINRGWWAGLVTATLLSLLLAWIRNTAPSYFNSEMLWWHLGLFVGIISLGIFISMLFTWFILNRYLRLSIQKLYNS